MLTGTAPTAVADYFGPKELPATSTFHARTI
jgi:hypothetical protein